ncbi:MAG: hypothetical protein KQI35_14830 [Bacteroidetes bacterium]|nr:hypothetical protein [Bacteroidota bacterium]
MSFSDQVFERIFPDKKGIEQGRLPVLAEEIKRDTVYKQAFEKWIGSHRKEEMLTTIEEAYQHALHQGSDLITRMAGQGFRGFIIHGEESNLTQQEASFLLDYWQNRILLLNYRLYSSYHEHFIRESQVLVEERYYFKPVIKDNEPPLDQEYGNILIESKTLGQSLLSVKCQTTSYTGFNYKTPLNHKELIDHLLK